MIEEKFFVKENLDRPWWFMCYLDVKDREDLTKIYGVILASGISHEQAEKTVKILAKPNTAYTLSIPHERTTVIVTSSVTSKMEFLNSISHELQHATVHICDTDNIEYSSEQAGYIQGEIGEQLYEGVSLLLCPKCKCGHNSKM